MSNQWLSTCSMNNSNKMGQPGGKTSNCGTTACSVKGALCFVFLSETPFEILSLIPRTCFSIKSAARLDLCLVFIPIKLHNQFLKLYPLMEKTFGYGSVETLCFAIRNKLYYLYGNTKQTYLISQFTVTNDFVIAL